MTIFKTTGNQVLGETPVSVYFISHPMSKLLLVLLVLINFSCGSKKNGLNIEINYIGDKGYLADSIPDLRNGNLILSFNSYYNRDTVQIRIGKHSKTICLLTDEITGSAETIELGKVTTQQTIELVIDNYKPISLKASPDNQIFLVTYYPDSLLRINSVFHLPSNQ
jgi:hypothetical protein